MSQRLPDAAAELLKTPLTVQQRLELIGELWDSIPDSTDSLPIPGWHREELERRLAAADADLEAAIPWEEVKRRLRGRSCARSYSGLRLKLMSLPLMIGMNSNNPAWETSF